MVLYTESAVTSKVGVNFVRIVVEGSGSLFHKTEQESDLGIDGVIELIRDGVPLSEQVAVQIKSGMSYYDDSVGECSIPVGSHRDYWLNHPLPVLGLVYVPVLDRAHWVDIKAYLTSRAHATVIRFMASEANRFDQSTFASMFVRRVMGEAPAIPLAEALALSRSARDDEFMVGLKVLFCRYPNSCESWDEIIRCFRGRPLDRMPRVLIYYLAHVPGHGDIYYRGETVSGDTRSYARSLLAQFGYDEVVKLLKCVDEENGVSRGSVGQSAEAVISSLPHASELLRRVVTDEALDDWTREVGALILAMNDGLASLPTVRILAECGSALAAEIVHHVQEYGWVNPYQ